MSVTDTNVAQLNLPAEPLTLEGSSVLHSMYRVRWAEWRDLDQASKREVVAEAAQALGQSEAQGESALFSMLGHKADLMFLHFRPDFEGLKAAELSLDATRLRKYLEPTTSYVSMVELGLYDSSLKLYHSLVEKGIAQHSPEWNAAIEETMNRQREAMRPRLFPKIPSTRYVCFYPMDRRRGEDKNWYVLSIQERQRQMEEHGLKGRRWAGKVQQIISGSIGFDDWEWGVDLFSNEPAHFKKLIYEMRFDTVSAEFSNFGTFFVGVRCATKDLCPLLSGKLPAKPE